MSNLFIMNHCGMGDHIITNGLTRELAKKYDKIYLPCYLSNSPSVSFMFSDLPSVIIQDMYAPSDIFTLQMHHERNGHEVLKLGMYSGETGHPEGETFDQTFYRQAGIDFQKRWDSFKCPYKHGYPKFANDPWIFISDSPERGYEIDRSRIVIPDGTKTLVPWVSEHIFLFQDLIYLAEEIHTIDSSWLHLIESIPTKAKLFYHLYARNGGAYNQAQKRKDWTILT